MTILMISHEHDVADRAGRRVRIARWKPGRGMTSEFTVPPRMTGGGSRAAAGAGRAAN
ncbi:MAG: hypothetical protein ACRD1K_18550 [Acidimicrobiales bacterium]